LTPDMVARCCVLGKDT